MLHFGRLEQIRAAPALVSNFAIAVDHVETARHAAIASPDGIIDRVDEHREAEGSTRPHFCATETRSS